MMESRVLNSFYFNYKSILVDEIALDGLSGIGIDLLWKRIEKRLNTSVTDKMKCKFWSFIINCDMISVFVNPLPAPIFELFDRFELIDDDSGNLKDCEFYFDGPYEFFPIDNVYGSCLHYNTRKPIEKSDIKDLTYDEIRTKYSDKLVLVASLQERWNSLSSNLPISYLSELTTTHYAMLELIGKSRENGQATAGNTNLTKIVKNPKFVFYHRNHLQKLGLIKVLYTTQWSDSTKRLSKCLLLRLKRFHKPSALSLPKSGLLHNVAKYLMQQPNYETSCTALFREGFIASHQQKRIRKSCIFKKEEKNIKSKKTKLLSLVFSSDESAQSEDESDKTPLQSQYKVKINLPRQAYQLVLDAGLKGLTLTELSQLLGVQSLTSRQLLKVLCKRKIVIEHLEEHGKQRIARYVAVACTTEEDKKLKEEKEKLLTYINKEGDARKRSRDSPTNTQEEYEAPSKKSKLDDDHSKENNITELDLITDTNEVGVISMLNSKRSTLRQLKIINGIIEITRQKNVICGFMELNKLVSQHTNEPPLDTKRIKVILQKLIIDKQIKIFSLKLPNNASKTLICAPHIQITDDIIKNKYRNICYQYEPKEPAAQSKRRNLFQNNMQKYTRLEVLHELIMDKVYFEKSENSMPEGTIWFLDFLPCLTIGYLLGTFPLRMPLFSLYLNISEESRKLRLQDAPAGLMKAVIRSQKLIAGLKEQMKILIAFGLLQLVDKLDFDGEVRSFIDFVFYVNREAKLVDTTGVWPRDSTDVKSLERKFTFHSSADVKQYWKTIRKFSFKTDTSGLKKDKRLSVPHAPVRRLNELDEHVGDVLGDGLGPCGFHSLFSTDNRRLWSNVNFKKVPVKQESCRAKKIQFPPTKKVKKSKAKVKMSKKQTQDGTILGQRLRMPQKSYMWSEREDQLLVLCNAAISIMSPVVNADTLRLRNTVAKIILTILDPSKQAAACHCRFKILKSNMKLLHQKEAIISDMKRRKRLISKYENALEALMASNEQNFDRCFNEGRLYMLELVYAMLMSTQRDPPRIPCIALDYEDFDKNFKINRYTEKTGSMYRTDYTEPELGTLKEGIMMTIMLTTRSNVKKSLYRDIYFTFKNYPEQRLRIATEQLKKSGAMTRKKKNSIRKLHSMSDRTSFQSYYRFSVNYERRWRCKMNMEFVDDLATLLKGMPEEIVLCSPHMNCLLVELLACDLVDLRLVKVPYVASSFGDTISQLDTMLSDLDDCKLKGGILSWKIKTEVKHLSELYKDVYHDTRWLIGHSLIKSNQEDNYADCDGQIVSQLDGKDKGMTFQELQDACKYDTDTLVQKLREMEHRHTIRRVGYFDNRIILTRYLKYWALNFKDTYIIPTPWFSMYGTIEIDILFKWAGVVMNVIFKQPGISVVGISNICDTLSTRSVQDICMYLEKCGCVRLNVVKVKQVDFFSCDDETPEILAFNEYESPNNILAFPVKNSLTKYAYVRSKYEKMIVKLYDDNE